MACLLAVCLLTSCASQVQQDSAKTPQEANPTSVEKSTSTGGATPKTETPACDDLLSLDQVARLSQVRMDRPRVERVGGLLDACKWYGKDNHDVTVLAASVSAVEWSKTVPDIVAMLLRSDYVKKYPKYLKELRQAKAILDSRGTLSAREACAIFSTVNESQGGPPGATATVRLLPPRGPPEAVTAQACSSRVFSTVTLAAPRVADSVAQGRRILRTLDAVHPGPIDLGY